MINCAQRRLRPCQSERTDGGHAPARDVLRMPYIGRLLCRAAGGRMIPRFNRSSRAERHHAVSSLPADWQASPRQTEGNPTSAVRRSNARPATDQR